uniref:RxLR effector candidate protein n=1 Tax=Hyaloperonospora arabidopsidis (strain Emoy2) TaxID=559515 RepID=M4BX77_HYAAE|nr:RxLR effector candidate protein [Hyaloperonospora arabidopsidis Emoy2]
MRSLPLVALVTRLLTYTAATPTSATTFSFESVGSSPTGANGQGTSSSSLRTPTSSSTELANDEDRTVSLTEGLGLKATEGAELLKGISGTGDKLVGATKLQDIAVMATEKTALEKQEAAAALKKGMKAKGNLGKEVLKGHGGSWVNMPGAGDHYVLTPDTKTQLARAEIERSKQVALFKPGQKTPDSLRKEMTITPGMKIVPENFLKSRVGRENERKDENRRVLTCSVVSNTDENPNHQVLLISSSNPKKKEWLLPKGGWDLDEEMLPSARREVIEEAGVSVKKAVRKLDRRDIIIKDGEKETGYVYHPVAMNARVTYDDAINILKDERPHMAAIVGDAAKRQKEPVDWINTQKRLGEKKKKERLQARLHPFSYFDRR